MVNLRHVSGPLLLIIPLVLTGTIGIFYNNFQNNGLVTPTVATFTGCPTLIAWNSPNNNAQAEICQAFNQTYTDPCQSAQNATYCGFQTPQILNPHSIYTCIINISWQCFTTVITGGSNTVQPLPFQFFSQPSPPIFNICLNINGTGFTGAFTPLGYLVTFQCDQIYQNGGRVPANQTTEYLGQYNCTNISNIGLAQNFGYFACNFVPSDTIPVATNDTWGAILAFNGTDVLSGGSYQTCLGNSGPFNSCDILGSALIYTAYNFTSMNSLDNPLGCVLTYNSAPTKLTPECRSWFSAIQQENSGTGSGIFVFGQVLALVGGIILTLIGFGLGFSGGALTFNFSVTPNSQGTRYAQILGFALLVIVPFDSEFTGPFTLLSIFGIGSIILTIFALFEFMGIFLMVAQPAVSQ